MHVSGVLLGVSPFGCGLAYVIQRSRKLHTFSGGLTIRHIRNTAVMRLGNRQFPRCIIAEFVIPRSNIGVFLRCVNSSISLVYINWRFMLCY